MARRGAKFFVAEIAASALMLAMVKRWKKPLIWTLFLVPSLLLLYVFSVGPFIYVGHRFDWDWDEWPQRGITLIYMPLQSIDGSRLDDMLEGYVGWWLELAERGKRQEK